MKLSKLFLLVLIASVFEIVALSFLTRYIKITKHPMDLVPPIVIYGVVVPFVLIHLIESVGMGSANFIWNIFTTIFAIIIGYYYFNEKIDGLHIISFTLGLVALILLIIANYYN